MKTCRKCKEEREAEHFTKNSERSDGLSSYCRTCSRKINKDRYDSLDVGTKRKYRKKGYLAFRYGITAEEYDRCMATSDCCEKCGVIPTDKNKTNKHPTSLVYDHCHVTGKFRGVLCNACNMSIGRLGDTLEGIKEAYDYMLRHYEVKEVKLNG